MNEQEGLEETYLAEIIPVYKKGLKCKCTNYRPIAKTSVLSKILERILISKIRNHLQMNGFTTTSQYGFTQNRSIQMNLLKYIGFILDKLKENPDSEVCSLYIDFSSAFQRVNYKILLEKIRSYRISGQIGLWLLKWLTNRKMCVNVNGATSDHVPVTSSVAEGSCLGPELYKIMLLDVPTHPEDPDFLLLSFADDTKLCRVIRNAQDIRLFQEHLMEFYQWAKSSHM